MPASVDNDEIMTLTEIAKYLKVSEKTVLRMVQAGEFPGVKVSNQWRFVRAMVDAWLSARMVVAPRSSLMDVIGTAACLVPMTRLVSLRRILPAVRPGDKADILSQLVVPLEADGLLSDASAYHRLLLAREEIVSTAIGPGFAIPHVRDPAETPVAPPCIVLGICREGADFGALDGRKTFVFAMPCAGSEAVHLQLLAQISLLLRNPDVLKQLGAAQTREAVMALLAAADQEMMAATAPAEGSPAREVRV